MDAMAEFDMILYGMLVSVIFGLFFAVICAILADRKGRSELGWAVLGFWFGVFALLVLAVLPDKTSDAAENPRWGVGSVGWKGRR